MADHELSTSVADHVISVRLKTCEDCQQIWDGMCTAPVRSLRSAEPRYRNPHTLFCILNQRHVNMQAAIVTPGCPLKKSALRGWMNYR